jgi:hypothetical protein
MSGNGWRSAHLSEIRPYEVDDEDLQGWLPVRERLDVSAFGVNAWVGAQPGDQVIEEHDELCDDDKGDHQELYVVLEGRATFTVDGEELDAPRGTFVFVEDPTIVRKAIAREAGTTVLAIGAGPGVPFSISPWEQRYRERSAV